MPKQAKKPSAKASKAKSTKTIQKKTPAKQSKAKQSKVRTSSKHSEQVKPIKTTIETFNSQADWFSLNHHYDH